MSFGRPAQTGLAQGRGPEPDAAPGPLASPRAVSATDVDGAAADADGAAGDTDRSAGDTDGSAGEGRLGAWMAQHRAEILAHLTGMLRSADEAEDVLQQVWIKAYRRPPDDGPGSNVRAWLYRVATHAALDRLGRDRRRRNALAERGHELKPEMPEAPDAGDGERLPTSARERIRAEVARLPRKQREAVWLRWAEGAEYGVIARSLDSSEESARANVYQGMKRLRTELFEVWKEESAK